MRTDTALVILALAALVALPGCDRFSFIGLSPESTADLPVFDFGGKEDLSGTGWVYGLYVSGRPLADSTAEWRTFWDIHVVEGRRYAVVDKLGYGGLPDGFRTVTYPESLPADFVYVAHPGVHGLGNEAYFLVTSAANGGRSIRGLTEEEFRAVIHPAP